MSNLNPPMVPTDHPPAYFEELPAYTNQRRILKPKEFQYKVEKNGKAIATLTLMTEGSLSRTMPTYTEGSSINGDVSVTLDRPETIQSVTVTVQGRFITGVNPEDQLQFMDISHNLWLPSQRHHTAPEGSTSRHATSTKDSPARLQGQHTWPFSIKLPRLVDLPLIGGASLGSFPLPQTFNEKSVPVTVYYEIIARVVRGKFNTDRRLSAQFGYIPVSRPPPLPPLRLIAYESGTSLVGPAIHGDEWHSRPVAPFHRIVNGGSFIDVSCTFYLAKPLAYTRGSLIPLCLRLESLNVAKLNVLSSPKSITVCLRRSVKYGTFEKAKNTKNIVYKVVEEDSARAVWWPTCPEETAEGYPPGEVVRYVSGELHLRSDLKPTSDMPLLQVDYSIVMLPFDVPGVKNFGPHVLARVPVKIVTAYAPGPRPVKYAPPGYDNCKHIPRTKQSNMLI